MNSWPPPAPAAPPRKDVAWWWGGSWRAVTGAGCDAGESSSSSGESDMGAKKEAGRGPPSMSPEVSLGRLPPVSPCGQDR